MGKVAGWVVAVVLVAVFASIEWRPWEIFSDRADAVAAGGPASTSAGSDMVGSVSGAVAKSSEASVLPSTSSMLGIPAGSGSAVSGDLARQAIRAQLTPARYTTLGAEINAKVQSMPVKEGDAFEPGAVLVLFDCVVQKAQLARVRAELEIAKRNADANERLLKLGTISRVEAQNSFSELTRAQAQVDELAAIVSKCEITAPYRGKVAEQRARAEQFVQVGQPVLEILDDSTLELEFIAPSKWAPWLTPGHGFVIQIDETGKAYPARVTRVAARIDSVSQTFKVVAQIDGEFDDLTPGMSGSVSVTPP